MDGFLNLILPILGAYIVRRKSSYKINFPQNKLKQTQKMVKENWSTYAAPQTATQSSAFLNSQAFVLEAVGSANSTGQVGTSSVPKSTTTTTATTSTSNPWGEFKSKENFVDMHFC